MANREFRKRGKKMKQVKNDLEMEAIERSKREEQKAISVEEFKAKTPISEQEPQYPRNRKQKEGGPTPSNVTENLQQMKPEPIRPPQAKGIRKALRGGGKAYGQNS